MRRTLTLILMAGLLLANAGTSDAQLLHKKKKVNKSTSAENTAEPDKVLYNRALDDIKHGRQEVGRLGLQTLINTYPDSEFLAKAKLGIADSYYKEGGTSNITQAIQGYKDFIIFFPFLPEAPYAQLQVANAHYRQMAKPDRDRSEAKAAEEEYQTFLTKYPKDPLADKAQQRLRDVQEVIAEGDYRIGYFYYVKGDKRAAAARLLTIAKRYPLYSKSDRVLWMLGDIFEKSEHREVASIYYSSIVKNYPLSTYSPKAKDKLVAFKVPVPQADPQAVAWMTAEQNAPRRYDGFIKKPLALVRSGPHDEMIASARSGPPNLEPEADNTSATDVLSGGGNRSQLGGARNAAVVEVVTPGSAAPAGSAAAPSDGAASSTDSPAPAAGTPATAPEAGGTAPAGQPASSDPPSGAATSSAAPASTPDGGASAAAAAGTGSDPKAESSSSSTDNSQASGADKSDSSQNGDDKDKKKESTSKKKKGIKKIIPW